MRVAACSPPAVASFGEARFELSQTRNQKPKSPNPLDSGIFRYIYPKS